MRAKGLTQEVLAKMVGVSTSAVSRWLGGSIPRPARLSELASCLGVTVSFLESAESKSELLTAAHKAVLAGDHELAARKFTPTLSQDDLLDGIAQWVEEAFGGKSDADRVLAQIEGALRLAGYIPRNPPTAPEKSGSPTA